LNSKSDLPSTTRIAIFASGSGTNAQKIIEYFKDNSAVNIRLILSNNPQAYVLERARNYQIDTMVFDRPALYETDKVLKTLKDINTDFIVLAGFMWLVPQNIVNEFEHRIINIHPALLPAYGGKGMYGMNVHNAVIAAHEKQSGITIHYVNDKYDKGDIIFKAECNISEEDTAETLAAKIHQLEYQHYPPIIEQTIKKQESFHEKD